VRVGGGVGGRECGWQGVGRGLVWKGLMLLPAAPARTSGRREVKERKPGKERKTTKTSPGDPGFPGMDPVSPVSLGPQNPKESLLGTRGIPREYPVSKGYPRDDAFENSW